MLMPHEEIKKETVKFFYDKPLCSPEGKILQNHAQKFFSWQKAGEKRIRSGGDLTKLKERDKLIEELSGKLPELLSCARPERLLSERYNVTRLQARAC